MAGKYLFPFALVTTLFALWGFANDVTNPLVKVFKDIFVIGMVVIEVMLVFVFSKMPETGHEANKSLALSAIFGRLLKNKGYVEGVFAQALYVGAQIMC